MTGFPTQNEMVLNHMRDYGSITPLQALRLYGCFRLGARIYDLKRKGINVVAKIIKNKKKHFASYSIEK